MRTAVALGDGLGVRESVGLRVCVGLGTSVAEAVEGRLGETFPAQPASQSSANRRPGVTNKNLIKAAFSPPWTAAGAVLSGKLKGWPKTACLLLTCERINTVDCILIYNRQRSA
jgi:hypothetical protein